MYSKIYDIVVDNFTENRDNFWKRVDMLNNQEFNSAKDIKDYLEKLLKDVKELEELEDIIDFLHNKIYK